LSSQPIRAGVAAATAAGLFAIAGCGSDEGATATAAKATSSPAATATPAAATATATAAPAAVPAALRGRWRRTMRAADFGGAGFPVGVWSMDVGRNGATDVYAPRKKTVDFTVQLTVDGRRLTAGEVPVCSSAGTYTWRATERRLTMAPVEDTCSARESLFGGTWTRMR